MIPPKAGRQRVRERAGARGHQRGRLVTEITVTHGFWQVRDGEDFVAACLEAMQRRGSRGSGGKFERDRSDSARRPRPSRDSPSCSWHEPTFKGLFQDGLPQLAAAGEAGLNGGFDMIEEGETAINLVHNPNLLCIRGNWKMNF